VDYIPFALFFAVCSPAFRLSAAIIRIAAFRKAMLEMMLEMMGKQE
jgi:hypothetical protein